MNKHLVALPVLLGLFCGQSAPAQNSRVDVACQNLKFVPSKPHVGDKLWVRFDVVNLSAVDIPGNSVEVALYLDDKRVVWSKAYPSSLKAHKRTEHSVAEQYMDALTRSGPHKYKLITWLRNGLVDSDSTNNVVEGVLNVLK